MKATQPSPQQEQEICVTCGLCCDGTLFDHALLQRGEKPHIPPLMQERYFKTGEQEAFKLPCPYFDQKCTVYNQKKAHVCSSFRCEVLKRFSKAKVNSKEALEIVTKAMTLREEVFTLYKTYYHKKTAPNFKELKKEVLEEKRIKTRKKTNKTLNLLCFKVNVLELYLIKHFKSDREYKAIFKD